MVFQQRNSMVGRKDPIFQRSLSVAGTQAIVCALTIKQWSGRTVEHFLWPQLLELLLNSAGCIWALKFGGAKLPCRQIQGSKTCTVAALRHCGQKIIFL